MIESEHLLTPREARAELQIESWTLQRLDGVLHPVRLPSGHRRYRRSAIEGYRAAREHARGARDALRGATP